MNDFFGLTVAAILTLFVYSYLLRDNPLYRLAEHLMVATGVAYLFVVSVHYVLIPRLLLPIQQNPTERPDLLIPLVLGLLLLAKAVPRGSRLGNPSLGYLVGGGLGLATGGAIVGTLIPQAVATMLPLIPGPTLTVGGAIANAVIVVGSMAVLFSFLYVTGPAGRRETEGREEAPRLPFWRRVGRWFIMIVFGSIFGGLTLTYVSLLVGRWDFLINDWLRPLLGL